MYSLPVLSALAMLFAIVLTPMMRGVFLRLRLVDAPDRKRKIHLHPIPRLGGIPVILSYAAVFGFLLLSPLRAADSLEAQLPFIFRLMPAMFVILLTGMIDDIRGLSPRQKLAGQTVAALLAYWGGVRMMEAGGQPIYWFSLPLTVFWLLACSNAFNLIDGMDGLAAGVGCLSATTIAVAALIGDNIPLALATAPLAAALLGFLVYNVAPASIFLGDSGSLTIGFLLGCYAVIWGNKATTWLGVVAPVMALGLPLLEVGTSIARRYLRAQPIFAPDRRHMHHRLLDLGLSPRRASAVLWAVYLFMAVCALLQNFFHAQYTAPILLVFCVGIFWVVRRLRYAEFSSAQRILFGGEFRDMVHAHTIMREFEERLGRSHSPVEVWEAVRDAAERSGFQEVRLRLDGLEFREAFRPASSGGARLALPFSAESGIEFVTDPRSAQASAAAALFAGAAVRAMNGNQAGAKIVPSREERMRSAQMQGGQP